MDRLAAIGALWGFTAVALGAFGAHGLEDRLTPEAGAWWETATFYLLTHALTVLFCTQDKARRSAGWMFALGAAVFSATLYAMALGAPRMLGAVTPFGGVALLAGWFLLLRASVKGR